MNQNKCTYLYCRSLTIFYLYFISSFPGRSSFPSSTVSPFSPVSFFFLLRTSFAMTNARALLAARLSRRERSLDTIPTTTDSARSFFGFFLLIPLVFVNFFLFVSSSALRMHFLKDFFPPRGVHVWRNVYEPLLNEHIRAEKKVDVFFCISATKKRIYGGCVHSCWFLNVKGREDLFVVAFFLKYIECSNTMNSQYSWISMNVLFQNSNTFW